jgi:hypothetical protein
VSTAILRHRGRWQNEVPLQDGGSTQWERRVVVVVANVPVADEDHFGHDGEDTAMASSRYCERTVRRPRNALSWLFIL